MSKTPLLRQQIVATVRRSDIRTSMSKTPLLRQQIVATVRRSGVSPRFHLSADADPKIDVVAGLHRTVADSRPLEKAHGEAVLAAADFRI